MSEEQTLVLIKPDGVMMGPQTVQAIKERYIDAGLVIKEERKQRMTECQARAFYREHRSRFYFPALFLAMSSGVSAGLVFSGENAITVVRELNGATNPAEAKPGTIRHDFRSAGGPFNTVHGSDSPEAFQREYVIFFEGE